MSDPGSAIVGKVGVGLLRAVAPGAIAWIKTQVVGRTVLFVGPARAGKTSFINYLRAGHYVDLADHVPSMRPDTPLQIIFEPLALLIASITLVIFRLIQIPFIG